VPGAPALDLKPNEKRGLDVAEAARKRLPKRRFARLNPLRNTNYLFFAPAAIGLARVTRKGASSEERHRTRQRADGLGWCSVPE